MSIMYRHPRPYRSQWLRSRWTDPSSYTQKWYALPQEKYILPAGMGLSRKQCRHCQRHGKNSEEGRRPPNITCIIGAPHWTRGTAPISPHKTMQPHRPCIDQLSGDPHRNSKILACSSGILCPTTTNSNFTNWKFMNTALVVAAKDVPGSQGHLEQRWQWHA